jgi:hypothetical protein
MGWFDLMGNRGGELPHRYDAVRMRQLHLQFPKLPLAAGNLQGNGSLHGEVCDPFDLVLRKGLYAPRPIASDPISSSFLSIGT